MAKIVTGSLVGEIRNRLGDQVFSRGRYGPYTRAFVEPDHTLTERRDTVQTIWAQVAERWNTAIGDTQRTAWQQYALGNPRTKSPIAPQQLQGRECFFRLNARLGYYGASYLDDPPNNEDVQQIITLSLTADADAQTVALSFTPSPLPPNHAAIIFASPSMNPGANSPGNTLRFIAYLDPGDTSPAALQTAWIPKFGAIPTGRKIFLRARLLNTDNGAYSVNRLTVATTSGTGDAMLYSKVDISAAQIANMLATPIELVPPPGTNKVLILHGFQLQNTGGDTDWIDPGDPGSRLALNTCGPTNGPYWKWKPSDLAFFYGNYDGYDDLVQFGVVSGSIPSGSGGEQPNTTDVRNQPMQLTLSDTVLELITGNTTARAHIWYSVADMPYPV